MKIQFAFKRLTKEEAHQYMRTGDKMWVERLVNGKMDKRLLIQADEAAVLEAVNILLDFEIAVSVHSVETTVPCYAPLNQICPNGGFWHTWCPFSPDAP